MLIQEKLGIIQNLQTSPIPQTSFLVGTFFCRFLQQDSSKKIKQPCYLINKKIPSGTFGTLKYIYIFSAIKAQEAGASAVIITDNNDANDELYVSMIDDTTGRPVDIPTAYLLGKNG